MSNEIKRSTLAVSQIESAAAAAVERAIEARKQAGIELTDEQVNNISGGATFYWKDPFIYGIKIDPYWFRPAVNDFNVNPAEIGGKTFGG